MLNFSPLWDSGWLIVLHASAAILAVVLGAIQFAMKKGTTSHRVLGRVWVLMMAGVALSSFAIHEIRLMGPFSPIHILSIATLSSLWFSMKAIKKGNVKGHRYAMIQLYCFGLMIAGAFTFFPGRIFYRVLFG